MNSTAGLRTILTHLHQYLLLLVFSSVGMFAGCHRGTYRAETEILPDGRLKRAILQTESLSEEDGWSKQWTTDSKWKGAIEESPEIDSEKFEGPGELAYSAIGTFKTIGDIPQNFEFERTANGEKFISKLDRKLSVIDHGFVKEYIWEETLTNVVTLSKMRSARRELFVLCLPILQKALETSHLKEYDWTSFVKWMESDGRDWVFEALDLYYEHSSTDSNDPSELEDRFYDLCSKHGLDLTQKMTAKEKQAAVAKFADELLKRLVKTENGEVITTPHRTDVLAGFQLANTEDDSVRERWDRLVNNAIENEVAGGQEAFKEKLDELSVRILGIYFFTGSRQFNYRVKVPGKMTGTNGSMDSENEVSWDFTASDSYPDGFQMTVRSLSVTDGKHAQLLAGGALKTRQQMKEYVRLVSDIRKELGKDGPADVDKLLANCKKTMSLRPLKLTYGLLKKNADWSDAASKLKSLLELIDKPD